MIKILSFAENILTKPFLTETNTIIVSNFENFNNIILCF